MSLDVHLNGKRIGALYPGGWREYSFAYSLEVVERVERGTPLLSCSLPVRAEPYGPEEIRPYVEGLLPEGARRAQIASDLGVDPHDGYALIAELGRDCPGAVTFLPRGSSLEPAEPDSPAWLDEDDLEELVGEGEPEWLADPEDGLAMRFALPGERHKLALVYDEQEDRWAWPTPRMPSTHVVKPQGDEFPGLAVNEMACTAALREMGLPAAHTELETIAGRPCLVSKRFDRWVEGAAVERLHQESFAQALGYLPGDCGGQGSGHAEARALLEAVGEADGVDALFAASYCNFLIGNGDWVHGRDSALLHTAAGPMLAPFHDVSSTAIHEHSAALRPLDEVVRRNSCLVGLVPIAIECGYALQPAIELAIETVAKLCRALGSVAARAQAEGWYEPLIDEILQRVIRRFEFLGEEMQILKPPGRNS